MLRPNRLYNAMIGSRLTGQWEGAHAAITFPAVTVRQGFYFPTTSVPAGYAAPHNGGIPAIMAGSMAGRRMPTVTITGVSQSAMAVGMVGTADITINADAIGSLIASGVAVASIEVNASAEIVGLLVGEGAGSVVIGAVSAAYGLAEMTANATVTVSAFSQALGLGLMVASTADTVSLTPVNIAAAVWDALASINNDPGTMGQLLNASGASGNPWIAPIDGAYTAGDVMRIIAAVLAGKSSGHPSAPIFRDLNDTLDRVTGTVDGEGNRTSTSVTP